MRGYSRLSDPRQIVSLPFAALDRRQVPQRWARRGGGLEANVFDGTDLSGDQDWRLLRSNLLYVLKLGCSQLTLHFPTDNADWVNDRRAFEKLRRFCDLAADAGAIGVTLHSNQFVAQDSWLEFDLTDARKRVIARLADLENHLGNWPLWLGIENMPVIGSRGTDYDSIFVYPADFASLGDLCSPRLGVTWDVCHWAITYSLTRAVAQLQQKTAPVAALDLPPVPLKHVHFGSFAGRAMPFWQSECVEGVPPERGDADTSLLAAMLRHAVDAGPDDLGIVFEIQEADYVCRENCWEALEWVRSRPELGNFLLRERDDR